MQAISSKTKQHRRYTKSSSFLMALLFTILCGAVALTLGYFINYAAKGYFIHGTQAVLNSELRYLNQLDIFPPEVTHDERLYLVLEDGRLPDDFPQLTSELNDGLFTFDWNDRRFAARIDSLTNGQKILVGVDVTQMSRDFAFMQWIGIISIIFVVIVVFVSYLISIFVVNGTNKIAETAHDIMVTGDLSRRIEMTSRWDDLSNLANILNLLFGRIEQLMQGVREVADNIAHDLRTPLTRMRNRIENLQKDDPQNSAYDSLIDEADKILITFNALLRISRIETERQRSRFSKLSLDQVLKDVIDFYEPLAEEKNITLKPDLEITHYHGDKDLLFQAFANIVDNALKFTPAGGNITMRLNKHSDKIHVTIQDSGAGVTDDDVNKIFQRFYRAEKSRHLPGAGLGLSLVCAVIDLHGGHIEAKNIKNGFQIITIL